MRNITVLNHRLDESNGIVENILGMEAKKTPWYLCFAGENENGGRCCRWCCWDRFAFRIALVVC